MASRQLSDVYTGRFAPSPTGPLHFGSLVAATASYLDARAAGGRWLVRMEDVDSPRVQPGAADNILRTLERLNFEWDGEVVYQSARTGAYREAFEHLRKMGYTYPCACTRKEVADSIIARQGTGQRYPGTCRGRLAQGRQPRAWRLRVMDAPITFQDRVKGLQQQNVERYCGDFILLRADGLFSYQLAVVVDDRDQGVTDVVRGADLLDSTPRQIYLQRLLGAKMPRYLHIPIAVNSLGQKLSKQTLALPIEAAAAPLHGALAFLGQDPPSGFSVGDLWKWALANWSAARIPSAQVLPAPIS